MTDRIAEIKRRWNKAIQVEKNPDLAFGDIKTLLSHIDQLQAERDAAVRAVTKIVCEKVNECAFCEHEKTHYLAFPCQSCCQDDGRMKNFELRGSQEGKR